MDPITRSIDKVEELLGHSPHPAIVAVPLGAWTVSNVADALYMVSGNEALDDAAQVSMAVGLVGAAGAAVTGLRDYGYIPKDRQPNHSIATTHAIGNAVVGSLFVTSYVMRARCRAAGHRAGLLPRLLALAGGALSVYTGYLGGKLVEEYGEAVKPVMEGQDAGREGRRLESGTSGQGREIPLGPQETREPAPESAGRRNGGPRRTR
ncbi:hypothetical protein OJF2_06330 [Aquisphaera giovannonii]|uniref:DUF2231 domain-containing protein n=1 Tax=Aquisphaera giovannonii TaxID=406548 RepID=A0A5B9VVQ9_9BACT|nr:DUF2231 domain-containing protein [Aquisphaera giovannonii]QEH32164.1 hypothetical protein OJF2_06330 [Aquisphaera giovannonii]